jgi:hypothetical protein
VLHVGVSEKTRERRETKERRQETREKFEKRERRAKRKQRKGEEMSSTSSTFFAEEKDVMEWCDCLQSAVTHPNNHVILLSLCLSLLCLSPLFLCFYVSLFLCFSVSPSLSPFLSFSSRLM